MAPVVSSIQPASTYRHCPASGWPELCMPCCLQSQSREAAAGASRPCSAAEHLPPGVYAVREGLTRPRSASPVLFRRQVDRAAAQAPAARHAADSLGPGVHFLHGAPPSFYGGLGRSNLRTAWPVCHCLASPAAGALDQSARHALCVCQLPPSHRTEHVQAAQRVDRQLCFRAAGQHVAAGHDTLAHSRNFALQRPHSAAAVDVSDDLMAQGWRGDPQRLPCRPHTALGHALPAR